MTSRMTERNELIRQMRRDGHTLQAVADHFGITRQRVEQISNGVKPDRLRHGARVEASRRLREQRTMQLEGLLNTPHPVGISRAAEITGIPLRVVSSIAREHGWSNWRRWSEDEVVEAMIRWHDAYGKWPTATDWHGTLTNYDRQQLAEFPSATTVTKMGWRRLKTEAQARVAARV